MFPVAGPLLAVHDGYNPDAVRLLDIEDSIWEDGRELAAGRRIKHPEQVRLEAKTVL
jgi:hypothetical protein